MKGVPLLKSLVSLTLHQFFSSCVAMEDLHMCRAVEQEQFNTWCTAAGIVTASDLALYFTSYAGALREAGRAVADGLDLARQESEPGLAARGRGHLHVRLCASPVFCSSASHLVLTFGGQAYTDFVCAACPRVCARRAPVWCGEGCRLFVPPGLAWCYGDADASPFAREHEYLTNSGPLLGVALREDGSGYGDVSGAHLDGPPEIHGTFGPSVP